MRHKQFYILGNPRSGSSLLRLILNSHSLISVPPECGFYLWLASKYRLWNNSNLNPTDIGLFINDVQNSKKFETWLLPSEVINNVIEEERPQNYNELATCVYLSYASLHDKEPQVLGDKNNYYIKHLDELNELSSNNFIIHIVRDGRDTVCSYREIKNIESSYKYRPDLPTGISDIAAEWESNNLNIYKYYKNNSQYLVVRYEDILNNPKKFLSLILDKFNLEFEPEMLNFYKNNQLKQIEPLETVAWKQKTLLPIDNKDIGIYKKKLTAREINQFNEIANEALNLFDYEIKR
ncbi:sulfotransferase family protein [Bizionia arctica]|uniref:Sulfotransferase n=1 Tax=Bizionia arctica TaxID=1495645 RepID=A0A917LRE3_9FLAO|nr:sulfotransferase [Bizionia arctica]GGG53208.1 sulfotransferase [Bizionia arctica]